jgi:hypothetical protein
MRQDLEAISHTERCKMISPVFQIEVIEPEGDDLTQIERAIEKYPVKVFQLLNKRVNKLHMLLLIVKMPEDDKNNELKRMEV